MKGLSLEASNFHHAALSAAAAVKGGTINVAPAGERGKEKEVKDARKALLVILSSLLYLSCQILAVRVPDDAESNLRLRVLMTFQNCGHAFVETSASRFPITFLMQC